MKPFKQAIDISFGKGLDTKTDPKRVQLGNFLDLENMVFTTGQQLTKRNGYAQLSSLPNSSYSYLTTFSKNLTAIGTNIAAYSSSNSSWISKGSIQPLQLSTLPLIRNNLNQTASDCAVATNGLVCVAYLEFNGSTAVNKYAIYDSVTGQNIVAPSAIPVGSGTVSGGMRVFILGNNFIILFTNTISGTDHLQYVAISTTVPTSVTANTDIASSYVSSTTLAYDAVIYGNYLYIAYNTTAGGQQIKYANLSTSLSLSASKTFSGYTATMMSLTVDSTNVSAVRIYISFYDAGGSTGYTATIDTNLNLIMNPVQIISSGTILNLTSSAMNGTCYIFYEVQNAYSFDASLPTNYIVGLTVTPLGSTFNSIFSSGAGTITASSATGLVNGMYLIDNTTAAHISAGTTFTVSGTTLTLSINTAGNSASSPGDAMTVATISSPVTIIRSVGLASKSFVINGIIYFLSAYSSAYQPTYFLINGSTSTQNNPVITAKLAWENGGGYLTKGLPNATIFGTTAKIPYLYKDLISAVNKGTNVPSGTQTAGVYSQTGVNLATFTLGTKGLDTAEIGNDLHLSGGYLWMYDGQLPVEHNFLLYPDDDTVNPTDQWSWSTSGGNIHAQPDGSTNTNAYYYQITYEWTDNQGNAFRSAPSVPIAVTTTGSGTSGSITLHIPTLRLTAKIASAVKIVVYRWSVAQQIYYQTTSISAPLLNDTTVDSVDFVDTHADATILGNNIIYTNGGVLEDINAPASNIITLFDNRLFLVDAEDPNTLYFSKQVIESTPVEMSDLLTMYVAPTTAAQGSTGPITAMSPMDDKLCLFKQNAIYYINGTGPDNTGANNQYSEPTFITATVGCTNQQSIVFMPQGLMFQSDKGIWLLGRDLSTTYIGAPVEKYNSALVESAQNIPQTNQVRFILNSGVTLVYDYYYSQWSTFSGVPAISSCIYNELHTFINSLGAVYQENPGSYLDGSNPVLVSFLTGPIRLGDLQNYQRIFFYYLLGTYYSPHKLVLNHYYDYSPTSQESCIITPTNNPLPWGSISPWGQSTVWGNGLSLENWRIFTQRQRCMAINIQLQEIYDPSLGISAGQGFTLSGINAICGFKSSFRPQAAVNSAGAGSSAANTGVSN